MRPGTRGPGRPIALRTVLRNLVVNAIKATVANGGGEIKPAGRGIGFVREIVVRDSGVGSPANENQPAVREVSTRGRRAAAQDPWLGFGLYIVRRFVELEHGG